MNQRITLSSMLIFLSVCSFAQEQSGGGETTTYSPLYTMERVAIIEGGIGTAAARNTSDFSFGTQVVVGMQVNPSFSVGVGTGIDKYKNATLVPLFADTRFYFIDGPMTPYLGGAIGYSLGFGNNKGGLILNPSFGIKFQTPSERDFIINIGYRNQKNTYKGTSYYYSGWNQYSYSYQAKQSLHFVTIRVGVVL